MSTAKLPLPGADWRGRCLNCRGSGGVDWDGTGCTPTDCPDCRGLGTYEGLPYRLLNEQIDNKQFAGVFGKMEMEVSAASITRRCITEGTWSGRYMYGEMSDGMEKDGFVHLVAYHWLAPTTNMQILETDTVNVWGDTIAFPDNWRAERFVLGKDFIKRVRERVLNTIVERLYK